MKLFTGIQIVYVIQILYRYSDSLCVFKFFTDIQVAYVHSNDSHAGPTKMVCWYWDVSFVFNWFMYRWSHSENWLSLSLTPSKVLFLQSGCCRSSRKTSSAQTIKLTNILWSWIILSIGSCWPGAQCQAAGSSMHFSDGGARSNLFSQTWFLFI